MANELIFLLITFLDLAVVLFAWKLGKQWLIGTILANIILTQTFAPKLLPIFGLVATASAAFYASIFIATDILTEHHGKKMGYQSIWMGFLAALMFMVFGQLVLQFSSVEDTAVLSAAMQTVFGALPRIVFASLLAYIIAQSFDIWFFHFIREKTGHHKLWLRNNLSTLTSQFLDSVIFFTVAFVGTLPFSLIIQLMVTAYILKAVVGVLDTPFIYLSYVIKGKTPPDFGRKTPTPTEATAAGM